MKIFKSLRCLDAKWVPTGKEGIVMEEGTVVASQYGRSIECVLEDGNKYYIPMCGDICFNDNTASIGTQFKGFRWIELGRIGRRADNRFHDKDVKHSTETVYRVSALIF